jgi:hypothetical protein
MWTVLVLKEANPTRCLLGFSAPDRVNAIS